MKSVYLSLFRIISTTVHLLISLLFASCSRCFLTTQFLIYLTLIFTLLVRSICSCLEQYTIYVLYATEITFKTAAKHGQCIIH